MDDLDRRVLSDIDAIADAHARLVRDGDGQFWRSLGNKHRRFIEQFGLKNFKRTINFEYGQRGGSSFKNPSIWRQVANLLRGGRLPIGGLLARYDAKDGFEAHRSLCLGVDCGLRSCATRVRPSRMRITLATENRFWRQQLGSHKRIRALVNYLASGGNDLSVVFLGQLYDPDEPGLASLPENYRFMAPFGYPLKPDDSSVGPPRESGLNNPRSALPNKRSSRPSERLRIPPVLQKEAQHVGVLRYANRNYETSSGRNIRKHFATSVPEPSRKR